MGAAFFAWKGGGSVAKEVYKYFSQVRAQQIKDEINDDIDFAGCILEELAEKYPFLRFRLHVEVDQEEAAEYMDVACTYTTNIKYND